VALGLALLDSALTGPARTQLDLADALLETARRATAARGQDSEAVPRAVLDLNRMAIARGILAGELAAARGEVDSEVAALESAVAAERVLRADLKRRPKNGWALRGLQQALAAQGKSDEADRVRREFERPWSRAHTWLPGPRLRLGLR
jgi:hypothetical protein